MKLHEYQSKALLRDCGIAVPDGHVATTVREARAFAAKLFEAGCSRVAVKAQVHAGGRGKGGGIKLAASADEAAEFASAMLGSQLVTPQTGPQGVAVNKVYIEAGADIANELYVALTLDRSRGCPVVIASAKGGIDIEEVADSDPDAILREHCQPGWGLRPFQATRLPSGDRWWKRGGKPGYARLLVIPRTPACVNSCGVCAAMPGKSHAA